MMQQKFPPIMAAEDFEILDDRFYDCVAISAAVERLYTGCRWAEGPAYFPLAQQLVWSDIPNNRMLRWDESTNSVGVFRAPSGYANGNTVDREGRLITCEHGNRRVTRTWHDGSVGVLADRWEGKRLNSPNDVVVASDGGIWFTDPSYGIDSDYEGDRAESEIGACNVYRIDPRDGRCRLVADGFERPNGLAFSPDEKRLYVADTGLDYGYLRVHDVLPCGKLGPGRDFARLDGAYYDGFRTDVDGRIWTSAGKAVACYDASGALLGKVRVPERVSNVVFGTAKRNRLFICATTSLYSVLLRVKGAKTF